MIRYTLNSKLSASYIRLTNRLQRKLYNNISAILYVNAVTTCDKKIILLLGNVLSEEVDDNVGEIAL